LGDIHPGAGALLRAPLRLVTRKSEVDPIDITQGTDNPDDSGRYWPLIGRGFNGADDFELGIYQLDPHEYHPRHYHPNGAEFYFVLSGSGTVQVGDDEDTVSPETAIYFPSHTVHSLRAGDAGICVLYGFNRGDSREAGMIWVE
jgi:quercetin dioxygenase-like cupin family protein